MSPQQIVDAALRTGAKSIAYTYTEPTIFYELAYDTAGLARAQGLKNVFVASGFMSENALKQVATGSRAASAPIVTRRSMGSRWTIPLMAIN
jgi:pyruvate formate lyase activating enzyme